MAAEHAKEACFFLLDVTETMGPHLADAKTVLKGLLTHKVLFAKQDVVGIGLVGTEGTDNMVHDEMGEVRQMAMDGCAATTEEMATWQKAPA